LVLAVLAVTLLVVLGQTVQTLFSAPSHQLVAVEAAHNPKVVTQAVRVVVLVVVQVRLVRLELLDKVLLAVALVLVEVRAVVVVVVHQQTAVTERMVEMVARAVLVQHQASQVLL
jgi:hypothetical protein